MALRTSLSVTPHLYMGDSTGRPLDMGTVYFGEQDKDPEFYPIELFSDDALTLPLAQPVHTKGGYLYDKGDMVEPHAKEIIYSVKVLDSYGRKVFYKGAMMRNSWNDDVIEQINAAIVASTDIARQVATDITNEAINNTAVEGGVLADTFVVVDGTLSQRTINKGLESIADLSNINNPKDGLRIYVKSYHAGLSIGGGEFVWDSALNKSYANGGTILDPTGLSSYNGSYSSLEAFLNTQGIGEGDGCWVRENRQKLNLVDFGAIPQFYDKKSKLYIPAGSYDISSPLQKCFDESKKFGWSNGIIQLPAGYFRLEKAVTFDVVGTEYSITLQGHAGQTIIMSSVVGENSINFNNVSHVVLKSFRLRTDVSNSNGHGIAFNSIKDGDTYPQYPNRVILDDVMVRGFKGVASVSSGEFDFPAAGIFIDRGISNVLENVISTGNSIGVLIYKAQHTNIQKGVIVSNDFCNIFCYETIDSTNIKSTNILGIGIPNIVTDNNIKSASIIAYQCDNSINISNIKYKGSAPLIRAYNTANINLHHSWVRASLTGYPTIQIESTTRGCHLNVKDSHFESEILTSSKEQFDIEFPNNDFDVKSRIINVEAIHAGSRNTIVVESCNFYVISDWEYAIRINHSSATNRTKFIVRNNTIRTHQGSHYPSGIENFMVVNSGVEDGEISHNNFHVVGRNKQTNYVDTVYKLTGTTQRGGLISYGNTYFISSSSDSNAYINNEIAPHERCGTVEISPHSSNSYSLIDEGLLVGAVLFSSFEVLKAEVTISEGVLEDVTHLIKCVPTDSVSKAISFRAYRIDTNETFTGILKVRYWATSYSN